MRANTIESMKLQCDALRDSFSGTDAQEFTLKLGARPAPKTGLTLRAPEMPKTQEQPRESRDPDADPKQPLSASTYFKIPRHRCPGERDFVWRAGSITMMIFLTPFRDDSSTKWAPAMSMIMEPKGLRR